MTIVTHAMYGEEERAFAGGGFAAVDHQVCYRLVVVVGDGFAVQ